MQRETDVPSKSRRLVPLFQPLEDLRVALENSQHLPSNTLLAPETSASTAIRGFEDPLDSGVSTLALGHASWGRYRLHRLAHVEQADGRGGKEDGAVKEGNRALVGGFAAAISLSLPQ